MYGPERLRRWLEEHAAVSVDGLRFRFTECGDFSQHPWPLFGGFSVAPFSVRHIHDSWGFVLRTPGGDVVYSGDTMHPCPALIEAGRNARLLIHEATFENDMADEAQAKNHSTIGQAIDAAVAMSPATRVVLTHFSQRYIGMPPFSHPHLDRVMVAFDFMSFSLNRDLEFLPKLLPVVVRLCSWFENPPIPGVGSISNFISNQLEE